MCDKTMENYKPNMFQLQCLKALEIQIEGEKGYKFKKDQKIRIKSNFVKKKMGRREKTMQQEIKK